MNNTHFTSYYNIKTLKTDLNNFSIQIMVEFLELKAKSSLKRPIFRLTSTNLGFK